MSLFEKEHLFAVQLGQRNERLFFCERMTLGEREHELVVGQLHALHVAEPSITRDDGAIERSGVQIGDEICGAIFGPEDAQFWKALAKTGSDVGEQVRSDGRE